MRKVNVIVFFLLALAASAFAVSPKVIKTVPENGNQNVDPGLRQIRIEFDQDMNIGGGFSICGGGPLYPKTIGKPKWINKRTLVMQVALEPVHEYQMSVNCPSYQNCKNTQGEPAEIYPISFKTTSAVSRDPNRPTQSPAVLLQQGIYAEETEGNLEKAMEIYSQIRSDYNDVERISAIATYQLGLCNLKKDKKQEAIELFQEVVNYYPNQTVVAKKAQQQLDKLGFIKDADKNIFEILDVEVCSFIGSKYGEACAEAGMKKLYSNSHIYVVDKDFAIRTGGMGYAMNWTDKPITGKYRLTGTTNPNQKLYDAMNSPIDVEIVPDANRSGFYNVYWTLKEPFKSGGFFSYGWETTPSRKTLAKTEQGYSLKMNNRFGDHCFETFFLAVPEGMQIVSKSEEYTGKNTLDGWDIYWWKKEVPQGTDHTVNIILKRPVEYTQEIHYDIEPNGLMHFWMPMHLKNNGNEPLSTYQFINSDFVSLTKMTDINDKPIEFNTTHEGTHFRYFITFSPPIKSGQDFVYNSYGTMNGLINPVSDMKDTYQYYMKHHPSSGKPTLRIETYLLPRGAEVVSTVPPNMKQTEKDGRIELAVEEVIPADGSITTSFQYKLAGTATLTPEQLQLETENITQQGWNLWKQRKLVEAEDTFKKAIELNPKSENAYQGLGWSQLNQGKRLNAKDSFEKCVAINPKNSAALNGLGWIADGQGDANEAIKWWEKAVEASNGMATASLEGLTKVYMERNDHINAAKYYKIWLKAEPNNIQAKEGLAKANKK